MIATAREFRLKSDEHFTVSGTLIEAWAALKSLRPKGEERSARTPPEDLGNTSVDFRGERRQNATHQSTTDPEARLAKKSAGKEARICYAESVMMKNRDGNLKDLRVGQASGRAEKRASAGNAASASRRWQDHGGWRQGLRQGGVRGELPRNQGHSTHSAE